MRSVQASDIELIKPTSLYRDATLEYKDEFTKNNEYISGSASLGSADTFESWLANVNNQAALNSPQGGKVPATQLLVVRKSDKRLVGMVSIRHELNDYLEHWGGHIGYSVRRSERRKGYATQMLKLALAYCRSLGISRALVTCDKENVGSAAVIKANGGILEDEVSRDGDSGVTQRYWISV